MGFAVCANSPSRSTRWIAECPSLLGLQALSLRGASWGVCDQCRFGRMNVLGIQFRPRIQVSSMGSDTGMPLGY